MKSWLPFQCFLQFMEPYIQYVYPKTNGIELTLVTFKQSINFTDNDENV